MNGVARIFVVANLLLAAGFLMAAATFLKQNEDWKGEHAKVSAEMDEAINAKQDEINALNEDLKRHKDDISSKEKQISTLEADKQDLDTRLKAEMQAKSTAVQDKEKLNGDHQRLVGTVSKLTTEINDIKGLVDKYRSEMVKAQQERDEAGRQRVAANEARDAQIKLVHDRDNTIAGLQKELEHTNNRLQAYIGAYPPPASGAQPAVQATVVRYDGPLNVIQLDAGKAKNISPGHEWDIVRGTKYICTVQVDEVDDNTAVGHVTIFAPGRKPQAGDTATNL